MEEKAQNESKDWHAIIETPYGVRHILNGKANYNDLL